MSAAKLEKLRLQQAALAAEIAALEAAEEKKTAKRVKKAPSKATPAAKAAPAAPAKVTAPAAAPPKKKAKAKFENSYDRYKREKAERAKRAADAELAPLGYLSENDIVALANALNDMHQKEVLAKDWNGIIDDAADYVHEKGTDAFVPRGYGYYHAVFHVFMKDGDRSAGHYIIKSWAKDLKVADINEIETIHKTGDAFTLEDANLHIAITWGFPSWFFNRTSAGGYIEVPEFGPCDAHELGSWDAANIKLTRRGVVQPCIGAYSGL